MQKKQDELNRGFKCNRDELLKDLSLIKAVYTTHDANSLSHRGHKILNKRLDQIFTSNQSRHEFWGQTQEELDKEPSLYELLFGKSA